MGRRPESGEAEKGGNEHAEPQASALSNSGRASRTVRGPLARAPGPPVTQPWVTAMAGLDWRAISSLTSEGALISVRSSEAPRW